MEKTVNVRAQVVNALARVLLDKAYANVVLQEEVKAHNYSDVDRRFFTELFYGVLRRLNYLDRIIVHFTGKPMHRLKPVVANSLRLALYQIIYLDKVPTEVAVHESVQLVKKRAFGLHSFVNGVLRNALRNQTAWAIETLAQTDMERLSLLYNQPIWLLEEWLRYDSLETVEALCQCFNQKAKLTGRLNTLKGSLSSLKMSLQEAGVDFVSMDGYEEALIIQHHQGQLEKASWVQEGLVALMDIGALAIAHIANPKAGDRVLDVCAAPGGKTFAMATMMENTGAILACDIHEHKLELLKENGKRLGASIVQVMKRDGTTLPIEEEGAYDVVLCDVPCSGWGILQKKLDMRWHKSLAEAKSLPALQEAILTTAARGVCPNGTLVYATCTLHKEENEGVVEAFLKTHPEFQLEDISDELPWEVKGPMVTLMPSVTGTDGFFIARMRRQGGSIKP